MTEKTRRKGAETRERLLDLAEAAVLEKGFGATSIDELIVAAGITKSGFFYHFRDKTALAKALFERTTAREDEMFDLLFARADALDDDPLHALLIALKLLAEMLEDLAENRPGVLTASFWYQDRFHDREVRALNAESLLRWRRRFRSRFDKAAARYPPGTAVDLDMLADMLMAVVDGGINLSRAHGETKLLARQVLLYRDFVRMIFQGGH